MTREILTIGVGTAGVRAAYRFWTLLCAEHGITRLGENPSPEDDEKLRCFFEETSGGQFVPRSLLVDLEPSIIDSVKNSEYAPIFDCSFLLSGKEDAGNNFARGYYTVGKEIIDKVNDRIRKLVDGCDNCQGFIIFHAVGGGTGSGLGALILERLAVDYPKKRKIAFTIYPSISHCVIEPYNALLSTHKLLELADISFIFDNEALIEYCQKLLNIEKPTYYHLNELIAYAASGITAFLRYDMEVNDDLDKFQLDLAPFPRLKFITVGLAGLTTQANGAIEKTNTQSLSENALSPDHFLTKTVNFNIEEDKYMALSLNYRGRSIKAKQANATVSWLKKNKKVTFLESGTAGFTIGLNKVVPPARPGWTIFPQGTIAMALINNTAIGRFFSEKIPAKYDLMYSQQAFVHWYVNEGMEEGLFEKARENLGFLAKEYLDLLTGGDDDDDDDDDDD